MEYAKPYYLAEASYLDPSRSYCRQPKTPGDSPTSTGGGDSNMSSYTVTNNMPGYQHSPIDFLHGSQPPGPVGHDIHTGINGLYPSRSMNSNYETFPRFRTSPHESVFDTQDCWMDDAEQYLNLSPESSPSSLPLGANFKSMNSKRPQASFEETEQYLRDTLGIRASVPLNLDALPDEPMGSRNPKISEMIKLAIWGSRDKKLTLRQIYEAIEKRYPSLKAQEDKPWQRSIRHNLSLKAMFVRVERPSNHPGKGYYWTLDIRQGEGNKRDRKRREGARGIKDEEDSEEPFSDTSSENDQSYHTGQHHRAPYTSVAHQHHHQIRPHFQQGHSVAQGYVQSSGGPISQPSGTAFPMDLQSSLSMPGPHQFVGNGFQAGPQLGFPTYIGHHHGSGQPTSFLGHRGYAPAQQMGMQGISPLQLQGASPMVPRQRQARSRTT